MLQPSPAASRRYFLFSQKFISNLQEPSLRLRTKLCRSSASMTGSDPESEVDLLLYDSISYEKRGVTHGVSYHDSADNKHGWTPVVGRMKKKIPLPEHVLR